MLSRWFRKAVGRCQKPRKHGSRRFALAAFRQAGYNCPLGRPSQFGRLHWPEVLIVSHLRIETTVLPGHRIEISAPELPEGAKVEVTVVVPEQRKTPFPSALEFLESLPPGPRAFKTWDEYEQHLREERNSWDR